MSDEKLTAKQAAAKIHANFMRGCVEEDQAKDCKRTTGCAEHQKAVAEAIIRSCSDNEEKQ